VAAVVLAGCGASQGLVGQPGSVPTSGKVLLPDENHITRSVVSNHVFSAAYSGHYTCWINSRGTYALYMGDGTASIPGFRRKSTEALGYHPCDSKKGAFTLIGRSPQDTITGDIRGRQCSADSYTVTGGTGGYTGATGSRTVTFTCPKKKQDYKDKWSGMISY
jgi:hypothetical protein